MENPDLRWWDLFSVGCVMVMLFIASYLLEDTGWVADLNHVTVLALTGGILGLALGQSKFKTRLVIWLVIAYSIILILWQMVFSIGGSTPWLDEYNIYILRVSTSTIQLLSGQPLQDGVLFYSAMCLLFWGIGFSSGYLLTRHGAPWIPLITAGIVMFIMQLFQIQPLHNNFATAVFTFLFLMLLARLNFLHSRQEWRENQVTEDKDTSNNYFRIALLLSLIVLLVAWSSPFAVRILTPGSAEQQDILSKFKGTWDALDNFFAPLRQKPANQIGYFGDSLDLGTIQPRNTDLLFTVFPSEDYFNEDQCYWRARIYDHYQNGLWQDSSYEELNISPQQTIESEIPTFARIMQFSIIANARLFSFYYPGEIITLDHESKMLFFVQENNKSVISLTPQQSLGQGDSYKVSTYLINPYLEQLQASGGQYPSWIKARFLQLPENLSLQISKLAGDLVKDKINIYDKVLAINNYLRGSFKYSESIDIVPKDQDPIEWFLFEEKKGFCNYFASAEVLLLRSIGIPARLSVGYAQGNSLDSGKTYQVREKDSHAWPEIYFPQIGWVIFEPTPALPNIYFQQYISSSGSIGQNDETGSLLKTPQANSNQTLGTHGGKNLEFSEGELGMPVQIINPITQFPVWLILLLTTIILVLVIFISRIRRKNQTVPVFIESTLMESGWETPKWLNYWAKYSRLSKIEKEFVNLDWMIMILGSSLKPSQTARDKVFFLVNQIPLAKEAATRLLNEYEQEIYGRSHASISNATKALRVLWRLTIIKKIENMIMKVRSLIIKKS